MDHDGNEHLLSSIEGDAIEGDAAHDLALLRSETLSTQPLPVRAAADVRKVDEVLALGSPLLDSRGNVVGVITATLDRLQTFRAAGVVPQNVNYVLKTKLVMDLIESSPGVGSLASVVAQNALITTVVDRSAASVFIVVAH